MRKEYYKNKRGGKKYKLDVTIELGRILGHLLGDGGIGNGKKAKYKSRHCRWENPL